MMWLERSTIWTRRSLAAIAALLLSACAQDPDLGRYKPTAFERINAVFSSGNDAGPSLPLTGTESNLHRISENLVSQRPAPEDDHLFGLISALKPEIVAPPSLGYYLRLRAQHPTSLAALVNAIAADVQADTMLMNQLLPICDEMNEADRSRADAFVGSPSALTTIALDDPASFTNVRKRLEENGRLIDTTADILAHRLVSYRTALAHARVDAPVPESLAVVADAIRQMEESLTLLERDAVRHQAIEASAAGGAST
ncbi:MAG TPA: hypothetical protein VGN05_14090 [Parvibaculum sp.]|jgi:hypothetical protein